MARPSPFRAFATCCGQTVRLANVMHDGDARTTAPHFLGHCPVCGTPHRAERYIRRKSMPSNHECDARCMNATGHQCECACGGANHGAGSVTDKTKALVARPIPTWFKPRPPVF